MKIFYIFVLTLSFLVTANKSIAQQNSEELSCEQRGFDLVSCEPGKTPAGYCPSNNLFFAKCVCNVETFPFNESNCFAPKVLNGEKCDNNYKACSCPEEYTKTCIAPMIGDGPSCDGDFLACKCPDGFRACQPKNPTAECREETGEVKYLDCKY